jgi:hypothetical protein
MTLAKSKSLIILEQAFIDGGTIDIQNKVSRETLVLHLVLNEICSRNGFDQTIGWDELAEGLKHFGPYYNSGQRIEWTEQELRVYLDELFNVGHIRLATNNPNL